MSASDGDVPMKLPETLGRPGSNVPDRRKPQRDGGVRDRTGSIARHRHAAGQLQSVRSSDESARRNSSLRKACRRAQATTLPTVRRWLSTRTWFVDHPLPWRPPQRRERARPAPADRDFHRSRHRGCGREERGHDGRFDAYIAARGKRPHIEPKPGDRLPLKDVEATVVSSAAKTVTTPFAGAGESNSACIPAAQPADNTSENARSTGIVVEFGKFRFLDVGDLTGQPIFALNLSKESHRPGRCLSGRSSRRYRCSQSCYVRRFQTQSGHPEQRDQERRRAGDLRTPSLSHRAGRRVAIASFRICRCC